MSSRAAEQRQASSSELHSNLYSERQQYNNQSLF